MRSREENLVDPAWAVVITLAVIAAVIWLIVLFSTSPPRLDPTAARLDPTAARLDRIEASLKLIEQVIVGTNGR